VLALASAGVDVFRLNFSHSDHADHAEALAAVRVAELGIERPLAVLADLQGPKFRIGAFHGGQANNVIPDTVELLGTIRSFDAGISERARRTVERLCAGTARAFRAKITPVFTSLLRGVVNDPRVTEICTQAARGLLGRNRVIMERKPSLGAEDFADYLTAVPGCMMMLGVRSPGAKITPLHTSRLMLDERVLLIGVKLFTRILLEWPAP